MQLENENEKTYRKSISNQVRRKGALKQILPLDLSPSIDAHD